MKLLRTYFLYPLLGGLLVAQIGNNLDNLTTPRGYGRPVLDDDEDVPPPPVLGAAGQDFRHRALIVTGSGLVLLGLLGWYLRSDRRASGPGA
jgi:hypothetical protein